MSESTEPSLGGPTRDRHVVANANRCTVHPQHVMVNQGRDESLYGDVYLCDCGERGLGNTDGNAARRNLSRGVTP